jgi:hypothetical protein
VNADDLISQVKGQPRFRLEVGLLLDAAAFEEARELNDLLARSSVLQDDDVTSEGTEAVTARLMDLYRETPEVKFVLEARSASEWETIRAANPDDAKFTLALVAACLVEPEGFDAGKVAELRDSLTAGQWFTLASAVRQVNEGLFDLRPTLAATVMMRGMRPNLTTAHLEESDIPSS